MTGNRGFKEFHKALEELIQQNWGVNVEFSDPFSWGYTSTSIYIRTQESKEYIAMLAVDSPQKRESIKKNIEITRRLKLAVKTPEYVRTIHGEYLLLIPRIEIPHGQDVENRILTLGKFIPGIPPFDVTNGILQQGIKLLYEIHTCGLDKNEEIGNLLPKIKGHKQTFLHGDMTPSNLLVHNNKLTGVLDFEMALIGPVEYDISRFVIFSWFRRKEKELKEILEMVSTQYSERAKSQLNRELLKTFMLLHVQKHVHNIRRHKNSYKELTKFNRDIEFAEKRLETLKQANL